MSARKRFLLSSEAEDDLQSIIQFTQLHWGSEQVKRYREMLLKGFGHLAQYPGLGRPSPEYGEPIRSRLIGEYFVFYMPVEEGVLITRIIHQRRNPGSFDS